MARQNRIEANEKLALFFFYLFSVIYFFTALLDNFWIFYWCVLEHSVEYSIADTLLSVLTLLWFAVVCYLRAITYPYCYYKRAFIPACAFLAGLFMWVNLDWAFNGLVFKLFGFHLYKRYPWVSFLIGLPLYFIIRKFFYWLGSRTFEPLYTFDDLQSIEEAVNANATEEADEEEGVHIPTLMERYDELHKKREAWENEVSHTCDNCLFYPDNCNLVYDHKMNGTDLPYDCGLFRRKGIMP